MLPDNLTWLSYAPIFPGYSFAHQLNCSISEWTYLTSPWFYPLVITLCSLNAAFLVMGVALNTVIVFVLSKSCADSLTSLILRQVALCDQFVLLLNTIDGLCHALENVSQLGAEGRQGLVYLHSFLWIFKASSISLRNWTMTLFSVCRACHILFPLRAGRVITHRRVANVLPLLWVFIGVINAPKFLEVGAQVTNCPPGRLVIHITSSRYLPSSYTWFSSVAFNSLCPLLICIVANISLLRCLRTRCQELTRQPGLPPSPFPLRRHHSMLINSSRRRSIRLVAALSALFVICQLPMVGYGIIVLYCSHPPVFVFANLIGTLMNDIDSSCNFFIFMHTHARFQATVRQLFGWGPGTAPKLDLQISLRRTHAGSQSPEAPARTLNSPLQEVPTIARFGVTRA